MTCPHGYDDCGGLQKHKPRSPEQHKRFFAMMKAAHDNWREGHEFTPRNRDHLRRWLTAKAGYADQSHITAQIPIGDLVILAETIAKAAKQDKDDVFIRITGPHRVTIYRPHSIAFAQMGHSTFCALNDAVSIVIGRELGISGDEILQSQCEVA